MDFTSLSDEDLLKSLSKTMASERQLVARVVAYLVEVEGRRLDLKSACSSLFDFCTRRLGMSEGESFRRITAARLVERYPNILGTLERGEIHLSALVLLRDHLTESNHDDLVRAASGKSKREVQELLAARFPRPDVPTQLQELRAASTDAPVSNERRAHDAFSGAKSRLEPLAETRFLLQLSIGRELRDKIERATQLMRHQNPKGDLAIMLERAVDLLIAKLEKDRLGRTSHPRKARGAKHGYVTRAVRRDVYARDGEQCIFISADGERCPARAFLEIDHIHARALAGGADSSNLRLFCKRHNALHAEQTFGRDHIERKIATRRRNVAARRGRAVDGDGCRQGHSASSPGHTEESDVAVAQVRAASEPGPVVESDVAVAQEFATAEPCHADESDGIRESRGERVRDFSGAEVAVTADDVLDELPAPVHLRQRKNEGRASARHELPEPFVLASRGLTGMGFRPSDVRRVLDSLCEHFGRVNDGVPAVEQILREALAALC